jgi:hypothetical protein
MIITFFKRIHSILKIIFSLLIFFLPELSLGQANIQVVTKTIEKTIPYVKGNSLNVKGEKATVEIKGWNENYIKVKIKLIAKHPDRAIAESDLKYLKYSITQENNVSRISNYFLSTSIYESKVNSNLKCHYEIYAPFSCPVTVTNKFGDTYISNMNTTLDLSQELGNTILNNIKGEIKLKSSYGDIKAENIDGIFNCIADKADIELKEVSGAYNIESDYGKINMTPKGIIRGININSSKTEVTLNLNKIDQFDYKISTYFSDINVPSDLMNKVTKNLASKSTFDLKQSGTVPMVSIATSFSPVTLQIIK